jgi:hypothetical protein
VSLADRDAALLPLAALSVRLAAPDLLVSTHLADVNELPGAWAALQDVELVIGSDVLYDERMATGVAAVLAYILRSPLEESGVPRRAILADESHRPHRAAFAAACRAKGLHVDEAPLPGPEGCIMLNVVADKC